VNRIDRIKHHEDIAEHVGAGLRMWRFPSGDHPVEIRAAADERSVSAPDRVSSDRSSK